VTRIISSNIITTADDDHAVDDGNQYVYIGQNVLVAAQGSGAAGVYSESYANLTVAGQLYGTYGLRANGAGSYNTVQVTSSGSINASSVGVYLFGSGTIYNSGFIGGYYGAYSSISSGSFSVNNTGTIAGTYSLYLQTGASYSATINNSGSISGYIILGLEIDKVTNSGTILGDVYLSGGNDVFDTRQGTLMGTVDGGTGDDILWGGSFDDVLSGGAGADQINGGAGSDTASYLNAYGVVIDMSNRTLNTGDAAGDIFSSIENVSGSYYSDKIYGTSGNNILSGSNGDDLLYGRGGNDQLIGGTGVDTMTGGTGDDIYFVDDATDVVKEVSGEGFDEVRSSVSWSLAGQNVELLTLVGEAAIDGTGNSVDNIIVGNDAVNVLNGLQGLDTLTGKGGADQFLMIGTPSLASLDTITDFQVAYDKIVLDRSYYKQVGQEGALSADAFRSSGAPDSSDRILYNPTTGLISYDADGAGGVAAIGFAQVTPGLALTANDFLIVA
jgi:Ca2+-binding RTX toxin-like protein